MVAEHPHDRFLAVVALRRRHAQHHGQGTCQQDDGHGGGKCDRRINVKRPRPVRICHSRITVGNEQRRKRQRVGNDEQPHPQFLRADCKGRLAAVPRLRLIHRHSFFVMHDSPSQCQKCEQENPKPIHEMPVDRGQLRRRGLRNPRTAPGAKGHVEQRQDSAGEVRAVRGGQNDRKNCCWDWWQATRPEAASWRQAMNCPARKSNPSPMVTHHQRLKGFPLAAGQLLSRHHDGDAADEQNHRVEPKNAGQRRASANPCPALFAPGTNWSAP